MNTQELIATVCPKIGALGSAFYFIPETLGKGKELGLDGFRFYLLGRGGVLGDVEPAVITSAFGYFNGPLIDKLWNDARTKVAPREAGRVYMGCAHAFGRAKFSSVTGLAEFCSAAEKVIAAAHPAGLAMFAGISSEPLVEDLPARAMQLIAVLREFRGSAHLVAVLASGLEPRVAHLMRRPEMAKAFGYPDEPFEPTDADRAKQSAADALTDQLVTPAYSALDSAGAAALVAGVEACEAAAAA